MFTYYTVMKKKTEIKKIPIQNNFLVIVSSLYLILPNSSYISPRLRVLVTEYF